MLDFQNISVRYGFQDVLSNVTFRVNKGERVGVVGPNGSGKSTLFKIVLGELSTDQGEKAEAVHRLGHRVFAHGGWANFYFAGDIQDMQSSTSFGADEGALWQAGRGELINYCNPFPSSENPEYFRRRIGMLMYKNHLHGHMMHGYAGVLSHGTSSQRTSAATGRSATSG